MRVGRPLATRPWHAPPEQHPSSLERQPQIVDADPPGDASAICHALGTSLPAEGLDPTSVRRTLLVTNDFPPRTGGIQSYLQSLAERLPPEDLVVYAPAWDGDADFDARQGFAVYRHPSALMLPGETVRRRAIELIREHRIGAVWYGAAAPLSLMTPRFRAEGIVRTVACTHGHEVGWSMLPGPRRALRRIGRSNDVVTYVSQYARHRIASALGPTASLEHLPPGVRTSTFRPDPIGRQRIRDTYQLRDARVLLCVSRLVARKGQDNLIRALPAVLARIPDVVLMIVGDGPRAQRLHRIAADLGVDDRVVFSGGVPWSELPAHYAAADVFAMPCRTRGSGLDVEGLGIVFLEAQASGLPVIAGRSGGAPETVRPDRTGVVVDGRQVDQIAAAAAALLADAGLRRDWGAAGRAWVQSTWNWDASAARLAELLSG